MPALRNINKLAPGGFAALGLTRIQQMPRNINSASQTYSRPAKFLIDEACLRCYEVGIKRISETKYFLTSSLRKDICCAVVY